MGEFLNRVRDRHDAPEAVAHRMALYLSSPDRKALIVEAGDDRYFYAMLIQRFNADHPPELYVSHGRAKIFKVLDILNALGKSDRAYAIVDRDFNFDDPTRLYNGRCLVLDVFSYENYLAEIQALTKLAQNFFSLEIDDIMLQRWKLIVETFLSSFPNLLLEEHAVAHACHASRLKCNLSNFSVTRFVDLQPSGLVVAPADGGRAFRKQTNVDESAIPSRDIRDWKSRLSKRAWTSWFRGHYFFDLLVVLVNRFRTELDREFEVVGRVRVRTKTELNSRHILEAAATFIPTSQVLLDFFEEMLA